MTYPNHLALLSTPKYVPRKTVFRTQCLTSTRSVYEQICLFQCAIVTLLFWTSVLQCWSQGWFTRQRLWRPYWRGVSRSYR